MQDSSKHGPERDKNALETHAFYSKKGVRDLFLILTTDLESIPRSLLWKSFGFDCPVRIILHQPNGTREVYLQEIGPEDLKKVGEMNTEAEKDEKSVKS
mgnify:CR=1 FL=1